MRQLIADMNSNFS